MSMFPMSPQDLMTPRDEELRDQQLVASLHRSHYGRWIAFALVVAVVAVGVVLLFVFTGGSGSGTGY
jgi:uncharacterized membrane-anchored protein